jgi:plastocyanin domain-containing protein
MSKIYGCARSFVIPAFNVRTVFSDSKSYVEFTPDKVGTFNVACSMNMYTGKITVTEYDGSTSEYIEQQAAPSRGSCGASGGGCGCGGGF